MAPPKRLKELKAQTILDLAGRRGAMRINPYPPNFRRIAAKIIEPATGASTCALGSQR